MANLDVHEQLASLVERVELTELDDALANGALLVERSAPDEVVLYVESRADHSAVVYDRLCCVVEQHHLIFAALSQSGARTVALRHPGVAAHELSVFGDLNEAERYRRTVAVADGGLPRIAGGLSTLVAPKASCNFLACSGKVCGLASRRQRVSYWGENADFGLTWKNFSLHQVATRGVAKSIKRVFKGFNDVDFLQRLATAFFGQRRRVAANEIPATILLQSKKSRHKM